MQSPDQRVLQPARRLQLDLLAAVIASGRLLQPCDHEKVLRLERPIDTRLSLNGILLQLKAQHKASVPKLHSTG